MGNKKNIIGLSMLLLVFLLGLSTTSYAKISDDFTYEEFQNIIYNMITNEGTRLTDWAESVIEDNAGTLQVLYDYDRENYFIGRATTGDNGLYIGFYETNSRTITGNAPNYTINIANNSGQNKLYWYLSPNTNFNTILTDTIRNGNSLSMQALPYFVSTYSFTGQGQTVPAGCNPSRITSGPYESAPPDPEMIFTPISPIGSQPIRVEDNVGIDCIGVEKNSTYKSMKFGDLYVPSYYYITNINVLWWYYNRGTDRWLYKYILQEDGDDITPSAYRSSIVNFKWEDSYKENETTIIHYSVWINRDFVINDTIYQIAVIGTKFKDGSPKFVGANYFIKSTYTTIVNGILDTDYIKNTPYGDEYNNIVGDIADKVDDLDDLTNSITAGIGNGLIGASGDWYPLNSLASGDDILGTAQLWGFRNYTNLYWQGIYQLLTNTFTVLGQTGSVDLDVSFHGYQKVISSDDIVSPPTAIKDFISLCMVTFTMIAIYRHFNKKIENIQAADTSKIKNEADDSNLM